MERRDITKEMLLEWYIDNLYRADDYQDDLLARFKIAVDKFGPYAVFDSFVVIRNIFHEDIFKLFTFVLMDSDIYNLDEQIRLHDERMQEIMQIPNAQFEDYDRVFGNEDALIGMIVASNDLMMDNKKQFLIWRAKLYDIMFK
ncbi:MAG: hypothetical protein MJ245_04900 [Clostridia bacterium]|nr:hypothetical protein [Clostridia bacterium]